MNHDEILTPEQIEQFKDEGYLAIEALTTQEDVAFLRKIYDRLFAERRGREEGKQFDLAGTDEEGKAAALPQILGPARYAPELNDSLLLKNCSMALSQIYGQPVEAQFAHAILKPPHHGAPTPWHQDAAYWDPTVINTSISVWVPLQEATLENGCMHFVPGSHKLDVLAHRPINNDPRIHGLELEPQILDQATQGAVACPLPPGGATFHGGYTLHYAPANRSDMPRRALILGGSMGTTPRKKPVTFPWQENRKTAREERALEAGRNQADNVAPRDIKAQ